jgi:rhodanese-related sulfurtransferase
VTSQPPSVKLRRSAISLFKGKTMQDLMSFVQHHWLLNTALFGVLFILVVLEFIKQKQGAVKLSPAKVTLLINRGNANIVDVRSQALYAEGHIIGALSVPVTDLPTSPKLEKLRAHPVVLVCASGMESVRAADALAKKAYDVRILAGGMRAWRDADMPVVKG